MECGFCEPVCPSRDLTTTPRQRIVIRREMARQPSGSPVQRALVEQYEYDGIQTCAADGTCAISCPLSIDTGKLIKGFRERERSAAAQRRAARLAERWAGAERLARSSLRAGSVAGPLMRAGAGAARSLFTDELIPTWPRNMPRPAPAKLPRRRARAPPRYTYRLASTASSAGLGATGRDCQLRRRSWQFRPGPAAQSGFRMTSPGIAVPSPGRRRATRTAPG